MIRKIATFLFFNCLMINNIILCDAPRAYQISFQDPASPVMESIIYFYDYIWNYLIFILIFVFWFTFRIIVLFSERPNQRVHVITQNVPLEIIWTTTPAIMLALIAGNSITHLYSAEEIMHATMDVTIIGSQWFWVYEFMVFDKKVVIESHMIESEDLKLGSVRNLEVDNALILPTETNIRLLVTSTDVIHSWAVPSLGVKIDAIPGRINEGALYIKRDGVFYGQCSEICGKGHAVMPITVCAVSKENYNLYLHILRQNESSLLNILSNRYENELGLKDILKTEK